MPTPQEELEHAMGHLARLRERFDASLTSEQQAWRREIEDADTDQHVRQSEIFEDELVRHLESPGPVLRLLYGHLVSQCFPEIGKCCRSPEEEDAEYDGRKTNGAKG